MRLDTVARPYVLRFPDTGTVFPLSSEEASRILQQYEIRSYQAGRVVLVAFGGTLVEILPATLGGGVAFVPSA